METETRGMGASPGMPAATRSWERLEGPSRDSRGAGSLGHPDASVLVFRTVVLSHSECGHWCQQPQDSRGGWGSCLLDPAPTQEAGVCPLSHQPPAATAPTRPAELTHRRDSGVSCTSSVWCTDLGRQSRLRWASLGLLFPQTLGLPSRAGLGRERPLQLLPGSRRSYLGRSGR